MLLTLYTGCCVCAPQGSVQGGVQGGAQVPPVSHSTAPPGVGGVRRDPAPSEAIQSIYQGAWVPRLAHSRGPHSYQLTVAQSAAIRHKEAAGERRSIYCVGAADRRRDCGGGVLAVRQLLVSGAGGSAGGRLTSDGGAHVRAHRPAVRGAQPRRPGFIVASAAKCAAVRARLTLRSATSLPAILSPPPL
ncbi:hypothetical protein KGM_212584 [Danaus plexippus plexippus]|uniref:Uncharacterized protein n=1 Tax=Danaus plexippus plexippus TaxID=278856 RepID=A0A212EIA7_DANPL|nr:hypothetical protein KGM_212584 [Danaus plexippus plexippus]